MLSGWLTFTTISLNSNKDCNTSQMIIFATGHMLTKEIDCI